MRLVDCHAHLEELENSEAAIHRAGKSGVSFIVEKHRRAIMAAPLSRILLETDSPVTYEGRKSEPADVVRTLRAVSKIKQIPEMDVARATTENAVQFFGLAFAMKP